MYQISEWNLSNDGSIEWRCEGVLHRIDGPAVLYPNGDSEWYFNGTLHRLDGPAVECEDGHIEYWVYGYLCKDEAEFIMKQLQYGIVNGKQIKLDD